MARRVRTNATNEPKPRADQAPLSDTHAQSELRQPIHNVAELPFPSTRPPRQAFQSATLIKQPPPASLPTSSGQRHVGQLETNSQSARPRKEASQSTWFGWLGAKDTKGAHHKLRALLGLGA